MKKRIVVAISGASGAPLAIDLLCQLKKLEEIETHLIYTQAALSTLAQETTLSLSELTALADKVYDNHDLGAAIASGTFKAEAMVVVPCSMKTLAGIVSGYSDTLLLRAADVTLKEGRKLIVVPRECPLSMIHLRNMEELSRYGAVIIPPMLSYYNHPKTVADCTRHITGKIMDHLHLECEDFKRWKEDEA